MSNEISERLARVDASLARQLQRAMEHNAKLAGALHAARNYFAGSGTAAATLATINRALADDEEGA